MQRRLVMATLNEYSGQWIVEFRIAKSEDAALPVPSVLSSTAAEKVESAELNLKSRECDCCQCGPCYCPAKILTAFALSRTASSSSAR